MKNDPYWLTARFHSTAANGAPIRKGDRVFYYPSTRRCFTGQAAIEAAADFSQCAADEAFESGSYAGGGND
jgi:hypothetical protein